jgi:hypothetical protein
MFFLQNGRREAGTAMGLLKPHGRRRLPDDFPSGVQAMRGRRYSNAISQTKAYGKQYIDLIVYS